MRLIRHTMHIPKEKAFVAGDDWNLTPDQVRNLSLALNAVEFVVDVDSGTIIAVNDKILKTAETYSGEP